MRTTTDGLRDTSLRGRLLRRITLLQSRYPGQMWQRVMRRDLAAHTLALAAQQVLCTAPFVVAGSAVLQRFGAGSVVDLLVNVLALDADSEAALAELFRPESSPAFRALLLSALVSLTFGLSVASTTQRMLETMWDVDRAPFSTMWRQLVWLAALIPGLAFTIYLAHLLRSPQWASSVSVVTIALTMGACATAFSLWSQWLLLIARIDWRRLVPGSIVIGVGIAIVSAGACLIVPSQIVEQSDNYGPIGVAFVLASWVVALTGAISTGVLAGAVLDERKLESDERHTAVRRRRARGLGPSPAEGATRAGGRGLRARRQVTTEDIEQR